MDESDWLACTDPQAMLAFLRDSGKLPERKARLFAVACCRRAWHLLPDAAARRAIEAAERFAEGQESPNELARARQQAWALLQAEGEKSSSWVDAVRAAGRAGCVCRSRSAAPCRPRSAALGFTLPGASSC